MNKFSMIWTKVILMNIRVKSILFGVLGLFIVIISIFTPWYYQDITIVHDMVYEDIKEESYREYRLTEKSETTKLEDEEITSKEKFSDDKDYGSEGAFQFTLLILFNFKFSNAYL